MNTYRAQCGRRREYNSQAEVNEYEAGWHDFPSVSPGFKTAPYNNGWCDREQDQQDREDARVERYLRETEDGQQ